MNILVLNAPAHSVLNLARIEKRGFRIFRCNALGETLVTLEENNIDMAVVFLRLIDRKVYHIIRVISRKYPDLKIIGVADSEVSELMSFMDHMKLQPIDVPSP